MGRSRTRTVRRPWAGALVPQASHPTTSAVASTAVPATSRPVSIAVFAASAAFFVWWQFRGRRERPRKERRRPVEKKPAMAIPKKRVRPSR